MNPGLRFAYSATARLARAASTVAALAPVGGESKLLRALRARHGIRARFADWASTHRDASRPLLWMHAPSVGEGLQARPVLGLVRARHPEVQLAYTHFSPSAAGFARALDVDFRDYLPFDTRADAAAALDALRPRALVFAKLDLWPVLADEAQTRGVRLGMISATLAASSSRAHGLAAALLHEAYARLDAVGAIDADDAERLVTLGVPRNVISITGDTRYDQVWERARRAEANLPPLVAALRSDRPTIVAGSTWPADEKVLLPAYSALRAALPDARLVIAPHEPTPAHLEPIVRWAEREGLALSRTSARRPESDVVLVDRVGILGDLYALADVAFVGGGFHAAGLHSVLEPAAFGAPVLFGPRCTGSRDAVLLAREGGGVSVPGRRELGAQLEDWLVRDVAARRAAGVRARELVQRGLGAAERSYALVAGLMGTG